MAILRVDEIPGRRRAEINDKGIRSYTREWQVVVDDMVSDSVVARDAPGVPLMFDFYLTNYAVDHDALVVDKQASEDSENPFLWHVEIKYSSDAGNPSQDAESPLDRPAVYKWSNDSTKRPAEIDLDGLYVTNSAGMAYDPPPEYDVAMRVLTVTRNEISFDASTLDPFAYAVNKEEFFGYPARQARMEPIDAEESFENGIEFWKITYIIKFRTDANGWKLNPLDNGPCILVGGNLEVVTDNKGAPVNGPVLLDGAGFELAPGAAPVYHHYRVYPDADFSSLNLEPQP